jgi:tetratricopeptide (TPR) repeat protein
MGRTMNVKSAIYILLLGTLSVTLSVPMARAQQSPAMVPVINNNGQTTVAPGAATSPSPSTGYVQPQQVQSTQQQAPSASQMQSLTQPQIYIWFGNHQINEASNLIKGSRYIEALSVLDKVIARDVRLTEAHVLQGVAYLQLKDFAKAKQSFNTVLTINRAYMGAYIYLADIALQEKNPDQARVYLQAIKTICQTTECAEYEYLKNALRTQGVATAE